MGRIEFPSMPIGAPAIHGASECAQIGFVQPTLDGLETQASPEMELGNCLVTAAGKFRKRARGNEWQCHIEVAPDLLHPDQEGDFEVHAYDRYADMAHSYHLRPGDRAVMRGTIQSQTISLGNGEQCSVNQFFVTAIEVVSRSKRTSMTVYEQRKKERKSSPIP
jgi:hypothetical protein